MESPESKAEKKERIFALLREAAREFKEDAKGGWVRIGYRARDMRTGKIETWYYDGSQIAEVTETTIIFAHGGTFPVEYVEDVELWREDG